MHDSSISSGYRRTPRRFVGGLDVALHCVVVYYISLADGACTAAIPTSRFRMEIISRLLFQLHSLAPMVRNVPRNHVACSRLSILPEPGVWGNFRPLSVSPGVEIVRGRRSVCPM